MVGKTLIPLVFLAFVPSALASGATGTAQLEHRLGSDLLGAVNGTCDATVLFLQRGSVLEFTSDGGEWLRETVTFNRTTLFDPTGQLIQTNQANVTQERQPTPAGMGTIEVLADGRLDTYAAPGPRVPNENTFPLSFQGDRVHTHKVVGGVETLLTYREFLGGPVPQHLGVAGPNRLSTVNNGTITIAGDLTLFLEGSTVSWTEASLSVPTRHELGPRLGVPGVVEHEIEWEHYAFLALHNAKMKVAADAARFYCHGLEASIRGEVRAFYAKGVVSVGGQEVTFDRRELILQGDLRWSETPKDSVVETRGEGEITGASLDFGALIVADARLPPLVNLGLWTTLVAALGTGLWFASKGAWGFFSRLKQEQILGHDSRRNVLEAVKAQPNVTLHKLTAQVRLPKSIVRYHVRVLETRGLLRSHKVSRDRCFVANDTLARQGRHLLEPSKNVMAQADPTLGAVVDLVPSGGIRLRLLLHDLVVRLGVTRPGAWKAVRRAERKGLVTTSKTGRQVWVKCVASS